VLLETLGGEGCRLLMGNPLIMLERETSELRAMESNLENDMSPQSSR